MNINNGFNVLPWYDSLEKQNSKKWYAYGQEWPLLCPQGTMLPFQFICDSAISITSTIYAINVQTGAATNLGITPTVTTVTRADATYYVVKLNSVAITSLPIGRYNLRMNTNMGYLYSEEIAVINNASECIKLEYWNEDTLRFTSGEINFEDDFRFILYINSTIGKPEYEFEEELTKRLGYKFIESQTSNKLYKFAFVAPEYICDALRLVRMCDYIKLTTKYDSYNALSFAYEPKWQEQGDLAAVDVEFDTDCIIQKLESFNRRVKESFYNALLADIDEPVLFSTDTVAQYYTEYTSVPLVNGKLIRQLEAISPVELQDSFESLVLALDNQADSKQEAKKVFISDILALVDSVSKLFKGHYDGAGNLLWIEALSHIGINGGLTMYIDNGKISLPSLYAGLPIDNSTLVWRDDVLMVNPDLEFGLNEDELSEYLTTHKYITDAYVDKSISTLETSVDKSIKAIRSYADSNFVTFAKDETITGIKDFTKGIKIDGLPITKLQDDVIYIDSNVVIRGGVTMYGENEVDIPTLMDAIAVDATMYNEGGILGVVKASTTKAGAAMFDSNFFSVDANGLVTLTNAPSSVSTLGSLLNVDVSVDSTANVDMVLFKAANSATWVYKNVNDIISGGGSSGATGDVLSAKFGSYSANSIYDFYYTGVQNGGDLPSTVFYGSLLTLPYRKAFGNTIPDFAAQIFIPNGDDATPFMYYRTSLANTWNEWKTVVSLNSNEVLEQVIYAESNYLNIISSVHAYITYYGNNYTYLGDIGFHGTYGEPSIWKASIGWRPIIYGADYNGNLVVSGGITMYSDIRKKQKLKDVELSLSQIANAPLIEHYYLSDQDKTTHVGSIAQYWAGLNDWFCKLDNEGYYTMEIQNAALASAISIARHLERYESKTDKKIRQIKKRISQLEDEIELLKKGA